MGNILANPVVCNFHAFYCSILTLSCSVADRNVPNGDERLHRRVPQPQEQEDSLHWTSLSVRVPHGNSVRDSSEYSAYTWSSLCTCTFISECDKHDMIKMSIF